MADSARAREIQASFRWGSTPQTEPSFIVKWTAIAVASLCECAGAGGRRVQICVGKLTLFDT